jgi:two-component system LytT family sensor kinase
VRLFKKNIELRQELRRQRSIVFGRKRYWFHIGIWLLVMVVISAQSGEFDQGFKAGANFTVAGQTKDLTLSVLLVNMVSGGLAAAIMVYLFLLFFIPYARYKRKKRYLWLGLITNLVVWACILVISGFSASLIYESGETRENMTGLAVGIVATFSLIITGYFFSIYYFIDLYDQQKQLNQYQKVFTDKLHAETSFLKTQINPHFLFNTLNNIYSLTLSKSADAARITRQLKELLTYMLNDCAQDTVALSGEIDFLKNYVALEQLRNKQEHIDISLNIAGDADGKEIAPLLLINFIENAFKHGVKSGIDRAYVRINLFIIDHMLSLEITNSKPEALASGEDLSVKHSGGIGIKNVRRRLDILYPNRHKLRISQSKKEFSVYLNINL